MKLTAIRCLTFAAVLSAGTALSMTTGLPTAPRGPWPRRPPPLPRPRPSAPPVARGRCGSPATLRDGGAVRGTAACLAARRAARGDRLLSFEVGVHVAGLHALPGGTCVRRGRRHGDAVRRPALRRRPRRHRPVPAGHRDRGRGGGDRPGHVHVPGHPRVAQRHGAASRVAALSRRAAARDRFMNGLPERRTGSSEEYFQVMPAALQRGRRRPVAAVPGRRGPWRAMPASRVFYTGKLRPGEHRVTVRDRQPGRGDDAAVPVAGGAAAGAAAPAPGPGGPAGIRRTWTAPATRCAGTGRSAG